MNKQNVFGTIIAVLVVIGGLVGGLTLNEMKSALDHANQLIDSHSGVIEQLSGKLQELTVVEVPEVELTTGVVEEGAGINDVVCVPGEQPTTPAGNYSGNTEILNTWASKNNCKISEVGVKFIIHLAKPLTKDNQVHVWFKDQNAYGRLVSKAGDSTLVYDSNAVLVNVPGRGEVAFDLAKAVSKGNVVLQTYVAAFDGNYIEAIETE